MDGTHFGAVPCRRQLRVGACEAALLAQYSLAAARPSDFSLFSCDPRSDFRNESSQHSLWHMGFAHTDRVLFRRAGTPARPRFQRSECALQSVEDTRRLSH